MPVSARQVSTMPDFLKGCAMLTSGTPFSRDARAEGIQSTTTSAPPPAMTCGGAMSGPPGLIVDVEPGFLVEAFVLGDEVAGELGLGDPFELDGHLDRRLCGRKRQDQAPAPAASASMWSSFITPPKRRTASPMCDTTDAKRLSRAR